MVPIELVQLKSLRNAKCSNTKKKCSLKSGRFLCGSCRRLCQKLCKQYHTGSCSGCKADAAAHELSSRLTYEYVFDILDDSAFENSSWMEWHWRDYGHTERIHRLWGIACGTDLVNGKFKWLCK